MRLLALSPLFLFGLFFGAPAGTVDADVVTATFWIETVKKPGGGHFLQLQYTQLVILDFNGLSWPHVSVATLRKKATAASVSRDASLKAVPGARRSGETDLT